MLEYHLAAKIDALSGPLHRVSISPNGRWLALAEAGTVTLVELSKYQVRHRIQCAVEKVNDVIWTPDGRLLCARGAEIAAINISLADRDGQIEISGYPLKIQNIKCVAAIDIGENMCIAAGGGDVIQLVLCSGSKWRIIGTIGHPPPTAFSGEQPVDVTSLNWYKGTDGHPVIVVSYIYHGVVGWTVSLDSHICSLALSWTITTDKCYKCAVSQDGSKLVVGKEGEGFHLYSRDTAAQIGQFRVPPESSGGCMSVYFAHKDLFLVGGSQTGEVRVWDIGSGDRIQTLKGAVGDVIDIAAYHRLEDNEDEDIFVIVSATHGAAFIWKAREA